MKRWLLFLLIIIHGTCLLSQTRLKNDTGYIEPRSFNNNALKELGSQKDFQYNRSKEPALSLWDKFWNWVWWKIGQLFRTQSGRTTIWSIIVLLAIVVIVFFVMKLTGMDKNGLFGRSAKGQQNYSLSQDDIHRISFDDAIEKAVNNGDFRLATRLYYLQALKKLSDKGYIDWRINKTNTDYLAEITERPFSATFSTLTFGFEDTWYGEKKVSKEQFSGIRQQFQQFNKEVQ